MSDKAYNAAHAEEHRRRSSQWVKDHPEEYRKRQCALYLKQQDERRRSAREWAKANPEKRKVQHINRKAAVRNAPGSFTDQEWRALLDKFGHRCLRCGKSKPLTADHVKPVTRGGSNEISNIQPLCASCNSAKRTREIDYRPLFTSTP